MGRGEDENNLRNRDLDNQVHADTKTSEILRAVARGQALPGGVAMIRNLAELKSAIASFQAGTLQDTTNRFGVADIKRHIVKQAFNLGYQNLIPRDMQGLSAEELGIVGLHNMLATFDDLKQESRFFSAKVRRSYASKGVAMPDGSFPIPDKDALRRAIKLAGKAKNPGAARRHVIKRARALGATSMLPDSWSVRQEVTLEEVNSKVFEQLLVCEGNIPLPLILEDKGTPENPGIMKIRVPFYVSNSLSNAPGFNKKVYFPGNILSNIVQEGKKDIAESRQPLTSYSRHAHALNATDLPCGAVVDLTQDSGIGYADIEVAPTSTGKDIQALVRAKHLNAVSLRARPDSFLMEDVKVNGQDAYGVKNLRISGIDFAPDSPAQNTYGIQILQEDVKVETNTNKEVSVELTLETLRSENASLVAEIEAPLRDRVTELENENKSLNQEITTFKEKETRAAISAYVDEIAAKHPKPEEAKPILAEIAGSCKSVEEFAAKVFPIMMESLKSGALPVATETAEEKLRKLFPNSGGGQVTDTLTQESEEDDKSEKVGALSVPA